MNAFTKNKILIVIETTKVTSEIIELIEKLKDDYKKNIPKFNIFNRNLTDRFDILVITDDVDENLLQNITSEILSTIITRGITCIKCLSIPILINERDNKLYISRFNNDSYSYIISYSKAKKRIRKILKSKNII